MVKFIFPPSEIVTASISSLNVIQEFKFSIIDENRTKKNVLAFSSVSDENIFVVPYNGNIQIKFYTIEDLIRINRPLDVYINDIEKMSFIESYILLVCDASVIESVSFNNFCNIIRILDFLKSEITYLFWERLELLYQKLLNTHDHQILVVEMLEYKFKELHYLKNPYLIILLIFFDNISIFPRIENHIIELDSQSYMKEIYDLDLSLNEFIFVITGKALYSMYSRIKEKKNFNVFEWLVKNTRIIEIRMVYMNIKTVSAVFYGIFNTLLGANFDVIHFYKCLIFGEISELIDQRVKKLRFIEVFFFDTDLNDTFERNNMEEFVLQNCYVRNFYDKQKLKNSMDISKMMHRIHIFSMKNIEIKRIKITDAIITKEWCVALSLFTHLKCFHLERCDFSAIEQDFLSSLFLLCFDTLETLILMKNINIEFLLIKLRLFSEIKTLILRGVFKNVDIVELLYISLFMKKIVTLNLNGIFIKNVNSMYMFDYNNLKFLSLNSLNFIYDFEKFTKEFKTPAIQSFNLTNFRVEASRLITFGFMKNIISLRLICCGVNNSFLNILSLLKLDNLELLDLSENVFNDSVNTRILQLPKITTLILKKCNLKRFNFLLRFLKSVLDKITTLNTDSSLILVNNFLNIKYFSNLKELDLSNMNFESRIYASLLKHIENSKLEKIFLRYAYISQCLINVLSRFRNLKYIDLSHCSLTFLRIKITPIIFENLQKLNLSNSIICCEEFKKLFRTHGKLFLQIENESYDYFDKPN
ncbi:hypothetical protein CWI38_0421p0030 [Hamiltosporidium tvaerminnensis]|uniref:Uncharacterized protein n=1 Tax=Hamiltosporidium tvaerminnensis TaxID=1176355 RepID=A0A4Q9LXF5_9MICR|nr:hypothetical protein CWI38_0421p0030 [Hamiltosporidium tvaerminnensis]